MTAICISQPLAQGRAATPYLSVLAGKPFTRRPPPLFRQKQQQTIALLGGLFEQVPLFRRQGGGSGAAAAAARRRLLEQLSSKQPDKAIISDACDELIAAQVTFKESDLGGGPWQVVYTRGPLLWQGPVSSSGGRVTRASNNQASQDFDPSAQRLVNRGELLGPQLAVTASGTYKPLPSTGSSSRSSSSRCPILVRASIEGGSLQAWGAQVPLPIRGSALVEVAYLDSSGLRIFQATNGSISVQMREPPAECAGGQ